MVENIWARADREGFSYEVDGDKTIQNTTKMYIYHMDTSVNDDNYEYAYMHEDGLDYSFDNFFKIERYI